MPAATVQLGVPHVDRSGHHLNVDPSPWANAATTPHTQPLSKDSRQLGMEILEEIRATISKDRFI